MLSDRMLQGLEGDVHLVDSEVSWGSVGAAVTAYGERDGPHEGAGASWGSLSVSTGLNR